MFCIVYLVFALAFAFVLCMFLPCWFPLGVLLIRFGGYEFMASLGCYYLLVHVRAFLGLVVLVSLRRLGDRYIFDVLASYL